MPWKKSSRSGNSGCVEVALDPALVAVRDSKNPTGPVLHFEPENWRAFIDLIRSGRYELPPA
jgi:hypothetical protein